ncbi:LuxR C-terminal-related transcriptional regulator [Prochlorococcus sp. MIT 1342]
MPQSAGSQRLSPAEQSVVTLLFEGLSNKAIAQRLILSPRTVEASVIPMG